MNFEKKYLYSTMQPTESDTIILTHIDLNTFKRILVEVFLWIYDSSSLTINSSTWINNNRTDVIVIVNIQYIQYIELATYIVILLKLTKNWIKKID